jgi:hypothetical protein
MPSGLSVSGVKHYMFIVSDDFTLCSKDNFCEDLDLDKFN